MRDEQVDVEQDLFLELIQRWRKDPEAFWDKAKAVNGFKCAYTNAVKKYAEKKSVRQVKTLSELPAKRAAGIQESWNGRKVVESQR